MEVVAFVNSRFGQRIVEFLVESGDADLVGVVVHPEESRECGEEILQVADLPKDRVLKASALRQDGGEQHLRDIGADLGVSAFFGYILPAPILELFPAGCVNLHPAYLPYNRGAYPNVWSIVDRTPAGVSLHYMDEGVDTGPILARRRVEKKSWDTGETLYRRLEDACITLFRDVWPDLVAGNLEAVEQDPEEGTHHYEADVEEIDPIDLDAQYEARELINRLRARTFPPHTSCYFEQEGERIYMRLHLWPEEEYPPEGQEGD